MEYVVHSGYIYENYKLFHSDVMIIYSGGVANATTVNSGGWRRCVVCLSRGFFGFRG